MSVSFEDSRRGPEWRQGWTSQTLSFPPAPFLAIFAIIILFLSMSNHAYYKVQMEKTQLALKLFLLMVPVLLIFMVRYMYANGLLSIRLPQPIQDSINRSDASPWGVALLLVLLLIMVSYKSSSG
ncbi:hypothetical protein GIB67_000084 [Kingdonia uniflora]|uniref:Transmembrane protein n=1 Tax=Kingdonia uniflora TaxID=39325 RepID=A0A7J7L136_9MAGN|nr:hypothetical protein GIB67_000084 [Kingdonia uniflora]